MDHGGCNDTGWFEVKVRADAAKLTNVKTARFRQWRDLVRECEMFVDYETKMSRVGMSVVKRKVLYFSKLFQPDEKKFSLRGAELVKRGCTAYSAYH